MKAAASQTRCSRGYLRLCALWHTTHAAAPAGCRGQLHQAPPWQQRHNRADLHHAGRAINHIKSKPPGHGAKEPILLETVTALHGVGWRRKCVDKV